ncbi:N-acetylglucosamine kinase [Emticicia sp. TH156]|uniref:N-acetylglucosamine kinase n=1 Tax=Emticicia sp. TH156 TaxID=2067454 RepID=UPI000C779F11|nr:N-acetylglucosamine kinase [Emticicia sp. TH156]PLK43233.1 N-acetylglucosamine kinase [Emticicia sp. TH156]
MILIADSGSTKTDWRILDKGQVVGQVRTVGFNPYYQDTDTIAAELKSGVLPQVSGNITDIYYYGTGITNDEKATVVRSALQAVFTTAGLIEVNSDVLGAARAACGHSPGIACILGTGSNSCYFDGEKIDFQVPPLGFWLGDEGSGGHLGKLLLLAYLHKEMPADIRQLFEAQYGVTDRLQVLENAYHRPFPNRYFAAFGKFLHDNIRHQFCDNLVRGAFNAFFEKYILKYPMCHEAELNFVGSVAFYYEQILSKEALKLKLQIGKILMAPIDGLVTFHTTKLLS